MITVNNYQFFYNEFGQLDSVNDATTGATVYIPGTDQYSPESNPLTAEFLETNPDLSDRPDLAIPDES
jgi:hypothetical protein